MSRHLSWVVAGSRNLRGIRPSTVPSAPPEEPSTLLGVGSVSTSLVDYPKTGPVTAGDYFVDPNAVTNGVGTIGDPFDNLASALSAVSDGQTILVRAGTLALSARITRGTAWATGINVYGYGTERPVLDFASNTATGNLAKGLLFEGGPEHWKGFEIINTTDVAVDLNVPNIKIEDVWAHHCYTDTTTNPGRGVMRSYESGAAVNNLFQDCAVWRCGDGVTATTNAPDCYQSPIMASVAVGVKFVRCFGAHGGDDCFDLYNVQDGHVIDCVAYKGGYYWNGVSAGDGSGFKMGGNLSGRGNNTLRGSIAIGCKSEAMKSNSVPVAGFFLNNTVVDSTGAGVTADNDATTGTHTFTNNISLGNSPNVYTGGTSVDTYNTWNSSADAGGNADFPITNAQFAATVSYDWSLDTGSPCIGAASDGGNLGASDVALEIAKEWLAKDLT